MVFLFPFHPEDQACAEKNLAWVKELGAAKGHSIILMPAKKIREFDRIRELASQSFDSVDVLPDAEGIEGHPQGPNSVMRQAIWHCQTASIGPWTFWEPDCILLVPDGFDQWEREYKGFGKPFMGEFRPASGVTPDYLSGNMVLPKDALLLAPMLSRRGLSRDGIELAFDIVAASQTLPQAHLTKLLQQVPKNPDGSSHSFPDQTSLSLIREEAVFFHPCKDGSLIDRLRERNTGVRGISVTVTNIPATEHLVAPQYVSKDEYEIVLRENDILRAELLKVKNKVFVEKDIAVSKVIEKDLLEKMGAPKKLSQSERMRQYWAKKKAAK